MNWTQHAKRLQEGETVSFRPRGNSMKGRIESGQLVTVQPFPSYEVDDCVFCKVNGTYYVHLVKAIGADGRYLIGNNHGRINGWTKNVFGKVTEVRD